MMNSRAALTGLLHTHFVKQIRHTQWELPEQLAINYLLTWTYSASQHVGVGKMAENLCNAVNFLAPLVRRRRRPAYVFRGVPDAVDHLFFGTVLTAQQAGLAGWSMSEEVASQDAETVLRASGKLVVITPHDVAWLCRQFDMAEELDRSEYFKEDQECYLNPRAQLKVVSHPYKNRFGLPQVDVA
jgi:hypothetical protein